MPGKCIALNCSLLYKGSKYCLEIERKTRQNAENKQTFDLTRKIENDEKTCQNAENKQTFEFDGKIEIEGKNSSNR